MTRFLLMPAAVADLEAIWDYTAGQWSIEQAERYVDDIATACHGLAKGSRIGRTVDVRPGYMKYRVEAHVIYYRPDREGLVIVRILHSGMDVERHLR